MTRTQAAEWSGLRVGTFGRWADGVTAMREDCAAFASHWQVHNERILTRARTDTATGPAPCSPWSDHPRLRAGRIPRFRAPPPAVHGNDWKARQSAGYTPAMARIARLLLVMPH
jgi:hypothetical protein